MAAAEPYIEREPPRDDWGVLACAECNRPLCNVDDFGSEGATEDDLERVVKDKWQKCTLCHNHSCESCHHDCSDCGGEVCVRCLVECARCSDTKCVKCAGEGGWVGFGCKRHPGCAVCSDCLESWGARERMEGCPQCF